MSYIPDGYQKWGNRQTPLETGTGNPVYEDADPALYFILDFASAVIAHHAGARWVEATNSVGLSGTPAWANLVPGVDPLLYFGQQQFKFPLLALTRETTTTVDLTISTDVDEAFLDLLYILPPLDFRQAMALSPFLNLFSQVVKGEILNKRSLFAANGIQDIKIQKTDFGTVPDETGKLHFPMFQMRLKVKETKQFPSGEGISIPLESAATKVNLMSDQPETDLNDVLVEFP